MKTIEFKKLIREEIRKVLKEAKIKKVGDRVYYGDESCTIVAVFPNMSAAKKAIKAKYPKDYRLHFNDMDSSVEDGWADPTGVWYELKPKDPKAFSGGAGMGVYFPTVMVSKEDL